MSHKKNQLCIILLFLFFISCKTDDTVRKDNHTSNPPLIEKDLDEILKEGVLKASTIYSGTSYFLYKGEPHGFEFELLTRFAAYLDVELEIIVTHNIDSIIPNLMTGNVDLVGYGLTITEDRQEKIAFSDYLYLNRQVLVQRKPKKWRKMKLHQIDKTIIRDAIELEGKVVSVRENTAYFERLRHLSNEIGGEIKIDTVSGEITTDEIIKMVVDGGVKYTVSDDNIANIVASSYPILDVRVPVSLSQKNAWALRKKSPKLHTELNKWLKGFKKQVDYKVIYNKYFTNKRAFRKRVKSEFYSLNSNTISEYDDIIKRKAKSINLDWRLLTSLIYQESQFNIHAKSWVGAGGLMQMMPATAKEMGVKNRFNPEDNLSGGVRYLKMMYNRFDKIEDTEQRIKFAMASYNCGYGHVTDAQLLADKNKLDRNKWDGNVEEMILALSLKKNYHLPFIKHGYVRGREPYTYIRQIFERYEHYKQFIEE